MTYARIFRICAPISAMTFALLGFNNCTLQKSMSSSSSSELSEGCSSAPAGLHNPTSIDDVTKLINSLPKPLTLPCLIENLSRPLNVFAMQSTASAQFSESSETPRIFIIRSNTFIMSVIPTGFGKNLLELSQYINSNESVKAEYEFPIQQNIALSLPFARINSSSGTDCRFCHTGEHAVPGYSGPASASSIIRPNSFSQLSSVHFRTSASVCDSAADPYRCALMRSVFITGQAQDTSVFP